MLRAFAKTRYVRIAEHGGLLLRKPRAIDFQTGMYHALITMGT